MPIELRPPTAEDAAELGRICYEAFKDISDRHHFPPDFESVALPRMFIGMLTQREDVFGVKAVSDGQPVGSNFLMTSDEVGGVGPITIEVPMQGQGIGRALMTAVLDHAREANIPMVRLCQDSFNLTSLSLYASLGFDVKSPLALMHPQAASEPDPSVRPHDARGPAGGRRAIPPHLQGKPSQRSRAISSDVPRLRARAGR